LYLEGERNKTSPGGRSIFDPRTQLRALKEILEYQPDVVITSLWRTIPTGALIKIARPSVKLVAFLHTAATPHMIDGVLHKFIIRLADQIWADSDATLRYRAGAHAEKGRIISFVTERLEPLLLREYVAPNFVTWGRVNHVKGIDRSFRFIAELSRRGFNPTFEIWGPDDGAEPSLRQLALELDIGHCATFRGPAPSETLPAIASQASFFLQMSHYEGMAMAVVEAMQLGLVPIVTPVGQVREYCRSGENSIIADPECIDTSVDEIVHLLENFTLYTRLQRSCLQTWADAELYPDQVCLAAVELLNQPRD
jgi:glycosyltransferase involved in cell wall biosynthesis